MPKIDFSGVDNYDPIPQGQYEAVLEKWEFKKNSKGGDQYSLEFEVTGPSHEGRKLFINWQVQPKSLWVMKRDLIRMGAPADDLGAEFDPDDFLPDMVGDSFTLDVTIGSYEKDGKTVYKNDAEIVDQDAAVPASALGF